VEWLKLLGRAAAANEGPLLLGTTVPVSDGFSLHQIRVVKLLQPTDPSTPGFWIYEGQMLDGPTKGSICHLQVDDHGQLRVVRLVSGKDTPSSSSLRRNESPAAASTAAAADVGRTKKTTSRIRKWGGSFWKKISKIGRSNNK
jgi:hypothetical protein